MDSADFPRLIQYVQQASFNMNGQRVFVHYTGSEPIRCRFSLRCMKYLGRFWRASFEDLQLELNFQTSFLRCETHRLVTLGNLTRSPSLGTKCFFATSFDGWINTLFHVDFVSYWHGFIFDILPYLQSQICLCRWDSVNSIHRPKWTS